MFRGKKASRVRRADRNRASFWARCRLDGGVGPRKGKIWLIYAIAKNGAEPKTAIMAGH